MGNLVQALGNSALGSMICITVNFFVGEKFTHQMYASNSPFCWMGKVFTLTVSYTWRMYPMVFCMGSACSQRVIWCGYP